MCGLRACAPFVGLIGLTCRDALQAAAQQLQQYMMFTAGPSLGPAGALNPQMVNLMVNPQMVKLRAFHTSKSIQVRLTCCKGRRRWRRGVPCVFPISPRS